MQFKRFLVFCQNLQPYGDIVLQIGETIPNNCSIWEKVVKIGTEPGLCILKTSWIGAHSNSDPNPIWRPNSKWPPQAHILCQFYVYLGGKSYKIELHVYVHKSKWSKSNITCVSESNMAVPFKMDATYRKKKILQLFMLPNDKHKHLRFGCSF